MGGGGFMWPTSPRHRRVVDLVLQRRVGHTEPDPTDGWLPLRGSLPAKVALGSYAARTPTYQEPTPRVCGRAVLQGGGGGS